MACGHVLFEALQLHVQVEDLAAHRPAERRRREAQQRVQQTQDRDQENQQLLDQDGEPEGQMALEERRPGLVELARLVAERQVYRLESRKIAGLVENAGS